MTKAELLAKISEDAGVNKTQAGAVLDSLAETLTDILKNDGKLTLPGVGIFSVGQRAARTGRNPQTGEAIQIAAAKTVKFKATKAIKDTLNS